MSKPTIIALTSMRGQSGKDTLIAELEKLGHKVHRVAFADILKVRCAETLGIEEQDVWDFMHGEFKDKDFPWLAINEIPEGPYKDYLLGQPDLGLNTPRSPRWHLQKFGTDYSRVFMGQPNVWLDAGIEEIKKAPEGCLVVVTDMRMMNEYVALSELTDGAFFPVRMQRLWHIPAIDQAPYHESDLQLIGNFMRAVVLNAWDQQADMPVQLRKQGVPV